MFHAPVEISHVGGCPSCRRVFHGDALSRGRHRLRGRWEYSNRNGPNDPNGPNAPSDLSSPSLRGPRDLGNPSSPRDPRDLSNSSHSSHSDYSSEASSFIPSSIRDLSRNEKLSLIVLRWLPSG